MLTDEQGSVIFHDHDEWSTVLNLIGSDCAFIYDYYQQNIPQMKRVLEFYVEFITSEINHLFKLTNCFDKIAAIHRIHFKEFIRKVDANVMQLPYSHKRTEDLYIIYISVQEWLLNGRQFYLTVDIDAFSFYQDREPPFIGAGTQMANVFNHRTAESF